MNVNGEGNEKRVAGMTAHEIAMLFGLSDDKVRITEET